MYTAASRALAVSETVVHLPKVSQLERYSLVTITLQPSEVVVRRTLDAAARWFERIGQFLAERVDDPIALVAPSVIVPEYNVVLYPRLITPAHTPI